MGVYNMEDISVVILVIYSLYYPWVQYLDTDFYIP